MYIQEQLSSVESLCGLHGMYNINRRVFPDELCRQCTILVHESVLFY